LLFLVRHWKIYRELVKSGLISPDNSLLESMDSEYNNYMETPPTGSQVKSSLNDIEKKTLKIQSHSVPSQNNSHTKIKLEDIKLEDTKDQNFIDKEDNLNDNKIEKKIALKKKNK